MKTLYLAIEHVELDASGRDSDGFNHGKPNALGANLYRVHVSSRHDGQLLPEGCDNFDRVLLRSRRNMLRSDTLHLAKEKVCSKLAHVVSHIEWVSE